MYQPERLRQHDETPPCSHILRKCLACPGVIMKLHLSSDFNLRRRLPEHYLLYVTWPCIFRHLFIFHMSRHHLTPLIFRRLYDFRCPCAFPALCPSQCFLCQSAPTPAGQISMQAAAWAPSQYEIVVEMQVMCMHTNDGGNIRPSQYPQAGSAHAQSLFAKD